MLCKTAAKSLVATLLAALILACTYGRPQARGINAPQDHEPRLGLAIKTAPFYKSFTSPEGLILILSEGRGAELFKRSSLLFINPEAAGDLTAIEVGAVREGDAVRVRLAAIYNDLETPDWRKDKRERLLGSFLIPVGESLQLDVMAQFGIEPFVVKTVDASVKVIGPGGGPRVINKTQSVEVVRLEKFLNGYSLIVKNGSSKNLTWLRVSIGDRYGTGLSIYHSFPYEGSEFAPGAVFKLGDGQMNIRGIQAEREGITLSAVAFDDFTFEGDDKFVREFLAEREGIKAQLPRVLRLIQRAHEAEDGDLQAAFESLPAQLQSLPEAVDKSSALELLRAKFAPLDEKGADWLYRQFEGGLSTPIRDARFRLERMKASARERRSLHPEDGAGEIRAIRLGLSLLKKDYERLRAKLQ